MEDDFEEEHKDLEDDDDDDDGSSSQYDQIIERGRPHAASMSDKGIEDDPRID